MALRIHAFTLGDFATNCYVLHDVLKVLIVLNLQVYVLLE